jgi:hypothetical protein
VQLLFPLFSLVQLSHLDYDWQEESSEYESWWAEFTEHPGYENNELESMVQQKAKLICSRQLEHHVAVELVHDEREMQQTR